MAVEAVDVGSAYAKQSEEVGVRRTDVLLLSMPFGWLSWPSIGLSLLAAGLRGQGITTQILYLNLRFARDVGVDTYQNIRHAQGELQLGEWIFSNALFERTPAEQDAYFRLVKEHFRRSPDGEQVQGPVMAAVERMRAHAGAFLDDCLRTVQAFSPKIVGFTCLSQQLLASLALSRRIHAEMPGATIVLGGPTCDGIPAVEIARRFPFVDAVVSGEGDEVFLRLVKRVLSGEPFDDLGGVHLARDGGVQGKGLIAPMVTDLDALPVPDYDDFLAQHNAVGFDADAVHIPFQTSRGCWWGERKHCTFCGLNGSHMAFRSKSPRRALEEILHLDRKYSGPPLHCVDSIPDMRYFRDVFPELTSRPGKGLIFLEIPCTLNKEQLRTLRDMRGARVQPGIESLSTPVLRLMRKAATLLDNVQLLKWCREYRIRPFWNLLTGIPAEPAEEYEHMAQLIPKLIHLDPPDTVGPFVLCRHSPYFESPDSFGLTGVTPHEAYRHIFPFPEESLAAIADYFDYVPKSVGAGQEADTAPVRRACKDWWDLYGQADLFFVDRGDALALFDSRPVAPERMAILSGLDRVLYVACDAARSLPYLMNLAAASGHASSSEVEERLNELVARQLMIREGISYLALALPVLPAGEYEPLLRDLKKLREFLAAHGTNQESKKVSQTMEKEE